jgi:hypothetical protein
MVRSTLFAGLVAVVAAAAVGCQSINPAPAASPKTSIDGLPVAPVAVALEPVVTNGTDSVTFLPSSPAGAVIGVVYAYDMPHCGINSPIDVDGSFWDAVGVPETSATFDGQPGTFKLDAANRASFTTTSGEAVQLVRHSGAKEFRICS